MKLLPKLFLAPVFAFALSGCADNDSLKHPEKPLSELELNYTTNHVEIGDLEASLKEVENLSAKFCMISGYRQGFSFQVDTVGQCNNIAEGLAPNGSIRAHSFNEEGEILVTYIKDTRSRMDHRISIRKYNN